MAKRQILYYPNPILIQPAKPVEIIDDEIKSLVDDMFETMYAEDGAGLAAPQIGISKQIVTIDLSKERNQPLCLINPEIVASKGERTHQEGCLSFPGIWIQVQRAEWVHMKALDINGEPFEIKTDEYLSIAIQHELDHLAGTVFIDRLSGLKRRMALKKYEKALRLRKAS